MINKKEKVRPLHFDKRPTPKFHSFGSTVPIMIFLSPGNIQNCDQSNIAKPLYIVSGRNWTTT
jgi:hypothetical protein